VLELATSVAVAVEVGVTTRLEMKLRPSSSADQQKTHVVLSNTGLMEEADATTNLSVDVEATDVVPEVDAGADGSTDADVLETDTGVDTTAEEEEAEHFPTVICAKNKMRSQQKRGGAKAYNITPTLLTISIFKRYLNPLASLKVVDLEAGIGLMKFTGVNATTMSAFDQVTYIKTYRASPHGSSAGTTRRS